jgi:ParB/RepB/Spo0J family partition protein
MNEAPKLIPIKWIGVNPYQLRQVEDPAAVAELAENIERNTLLQPPTVRRCAGVGEIYELAFGHTRLAAFRLLVSQGKAGYEQMPCFVRELEDLQMFEFAVAENIKRRDLNQIERATAMNTYMQRFKKTSAETGQFFDCDEATVRGTVRLLRLPEIAKEKLASNEMTVGTARKLLTVQRAAGAAAAEKITRELSKPNADVEEVVNHQLKASTDGIEMWASWRDQEAPQAGVGLWPLATSKENFPNDLLPVISEAEEAKALGQEFTAEMRAKLRTWNEILCLRKPELIQKLITEGAPENDIERLVHLIEPPACTACPFYARLDKQHYCAFAACHKRKVKAWSQAELRKLSKKLDLPIYNPKEHGKETYVLKKGWNDESKAQKFFDARSDVCLQAKHNSSQSMYGNNHDFTDSYTVQAILVGQTALKLIEQRKKTNAPGAQAEKWEKQRRLQNIESENRQHSGSFIENVAAPIFAPAFAGMDKVEPLLALLQMDPDKKFEAASKGKKLELLRQEMADRALEHVANYEIKKNGPLATAKHLQGVAKTWGVKLPENWLELVQPFLKGLKEYQGLDGKTVVVSAETASAEEVA